MGARGTWAYQAEFGSEGLAAAMVPICGAGELSKVKNLLSIPIWAFHGEDDTVIKPFINGGSVPMVKTINAYSPVFKAKVTIFPHVGHNSWIKTYNNSGLGTSSDRYDPFDMTIYDWMFQYRKE